MQPWICRSCRLVIYSNLRPTSRRLISSSKSLTQAPQKTPNGGLALTRNIGIIAHIDAGKTTTTERMLYYSGFTRRLGDVDDGSTVTDFLPAERARGITIQSAAITFHWPTRPSPSEKDHPQKTSHTINLIDTPGHADFTFEVIRSLRILDGAITILDGVAGVEAQTEKVWHQANGYQIPRIIFVNKLDRDGAAFRRTVAEIASRLHTWPALCQIPWWKDGKLIGVGDVINFRVLSWENSKDGSDFKVLDIIDVSKGDQTFIDEVRTARTALIEILTEHDDVIVEQFLDSNEDWEGFSADLITASLRRILLSGGQKVTPIFVGASFRNIGVQPLLDSINDLLPSPLETLDPNISLGDHHTSLREWINPQTAIAISSNAKPGTSPKAAFDTSKLAACALAFKVVNDVKRGVLVYIRVYSGSVGRNALLYNTNLALSERSPRLLQMYANEAVEVESIEEGQIGVIAGLKHTRTGDTLIVFKGASPKTGPPAPINTLQLRPIEVPPPLFFTSVEPNSLAEEKHLQESLELLLREDPSLSVSTDPDSGQTHLAGMGELHLEIARDRLVNDFKVKASTGKIEIGYREALQDSSDLCTETFAREIAGKHSEAACSVLVIPMDESSVPDEESVGTYAHVFKLPDSNYLTVQHPTLNRNGKPRTSDNPALPATLPLPTILNALRNGVTAALARGPMHALPIYSAHAIINFDPQSDLTSTSTSTSITSAARIAVSAALKSSASKQETALMEPVMLATIAINESSLGAVVHDISSARGGQVQSLDVTADDESDGSSRGNEVHLPVRLSQAQLSRVYAPPDPFGGQSSGGRGSSLDELGGDQPRQIRARVPLKEMVGYLKHLRSLTGGRGTFVMSVDRFEKMSAQRMKVALSEMRGDFT